MEALHRIPSVAIALLLVGVTMLSGAVPAQAGPDAPAASHDCDIWWDAVLHDTFNSDYRSIIGPTTPGNTVKLRLRTAECDLTDARVRVWNDRTNTESYLAMTWDGGYDNSSTYDWYYVDIPVGSDPTILYYFFELNDAPGTCSADQDFYVDDDPKFYGGGWGAMSDGYDDSRSFQLTVYDPAFDVPSWMQRGIVYQIFPDRFRDGNASNDPASGRFFYDEPTGTIVRSNTATWNTVVCDPRVAGAACTGKYSSNFYGGDLAGITEKINAGYFDSLGVTILYLNPIFRSPSNHKYDTADYLTVDPDFGTKAEFDALVSAANSHGIKIILDGVFNHVSSDSKYFDRYGRDAAVGACEATASPYRNWFYFSDAFAIYNPGKDDGVEVKCADNPPGRTYEAWYGYSSLPKLQANTTAVRQLIWSNGVSSVGPYWVQQGARGWRFDVGADVDCGLTCDPANDYWEGFRAAVRAVSAETVTLGEEWGDASGWLLGGEWDSVMNYRFRSALLSWLFTGCSGNGCPAGTVFSENDSNANSSSGAISYISPSQLNARLRSIQEDYPPLAFKAMMNLEGSHDTNRMRFLLKKINHDSDSAAVQRMKEWWLFAFTYAGAPTLYYGDEVGLNQDGVWSAADGTWQDDPYNRAPFPWDDTPGAFTADTTGLQAFARKMASIRQSYRALQDGDVQHGIIIDDANRIYGYGRTTGSQTALIALRRGTGAAIDVTFSGLNAAPYNLPDGSELYESIEGNSYTVSSGSVTVPVDQAWGVVLLEKSKIETPKAPILQVSRPAGTEDVQLRWAQVTQDTNNEPEVATSYEIHRSTSPYFTPGLATRLPTTVAAPAFGAAGGLVTYTDPGRIGNAGTNYYYKVIGANAAARSSAASNHVAEFDFALTAGTP